MPWHSYEDNSVESVFSYTFGVLRGPTLTARLAEKHFYSLSHFQCRRITIKFLGHFYFSRNQDPRWQIITSQPAAQSVSISNYQFVIILLFISFVITKFISFICQLSWRTIYSKSLKSPQTNKQNHKLKAPQTSVRELIPKRNLF